MRDDLLPVQACLDWAETQFTRNLFDKLESWRNSAPYRLVEERHPEIRQQVIKLDGVKPVSRLINVEVGMIIHAMRSALDLLMVVLAERNGHRAPKDIYFPVGRSFSDFIDPKNGAIKKIHRLSAVDRAAIEALKPYKGGDDVIFALHQLDLTRKHRELLRVQHFPSAIGVTPAALRQALEIVPVWPGFYDGAIVATTMIGATDYQPQITLAIAFEQMGLSATDGRGVLEVIAIFYGKVSDIIKMFN